MSTSKIVLTTVLTTLTAAVFAVVLGVSLLPSGAIAHSGWQSPGHHRSSFHRHGGTDMKERCEHLSAQHTRIAGALASAYLDLDDNQEAAMAPLLDIMESWRADSQGLCFELANADSHSVTSGMAMLEQLLSRSAAAVADMQPAYAAFETTLSDDQRAKIQDGINRHHNPDHG